MYNNTFVYHLYKTKELGSISLTCIIRFRILI